MDDINARILARRVLILDSEDDPRVGDFVRFANGVERRISHDWENFGGGLQTSDSGSFYLGNEGCNFSGGLYPGIPHESLIPTDETKLGAVWFFHHDSWRPHSGVDAEIPFRVYTTELEAPR